eukprot:Colp12_sorted_trinity150504_noHs@21581
MKLPILLLVLVIARTSFALNCDCVSCTINLCNYLDIGNRVCNPECNNVECGWDGYDCDSNQPTKYYCPCGCLITAPNCDWSKLGDGVCNSECNFSECYFDGGDCGNGNGKLACM